MQLLLQLPTRSACVLSVHVKRLSVFRLSRGQGVGRQEVMLAHSQMLVLYQQGWLHACSTSAYYAWCVCLQQTELQHCLREASLWCRAICSVRLHPHHCARWLASSVHLLPTSRVVTSCFLAWTYNLLLDSL